MNRGAMIAVGGTVGLLVGWLTRPEVYGLSRPLSLGEFFKNVSPGPDSPLHDHAVQMATHVGIALVVGLILGFVVVKFIGGQKAKLS